MTHLRIAIGATFAALSTLALVACTNVSQSTNAGGNGGRPGSQPGVLRYADIQEPDSLNPLVSTQALRSTLSRPPIPKSGTMKEAVLRLRTYCASRCCSPCRQKRSASRNAKDSALDADVIATTRYATAIQARSMRGGQPLPTSAARSKRKVESDLRLQPHSRGERLKGICNAESKAAPLQGPHLQAPFARRAHSYYRLGMS